jgi:hypothetical protein
MIVGETIRLNRVEEQFGVWKASNGSAVATAPDGSQTTLQVDVSPTGMSTTQVLSALITPVLGGEYSICWNYSTNSGESITRKDARYAMFTDAKAIALFRLQRKGDELSDPDFEREFSLVARKLLARWPEIGNGIETLATMGVYNGLSGDDAAFFDEAAALLTCVRMAGPLMSGGSVTDLETIKAGDEQYSFAHADTAALGDAPGDPAGGISGANERKRWIYEAAESLLKVRVVQEVSLARSSTFRMFRAWGPTKAAHENGVPSSLLGDTIRLLTDAFDALDHRHWSDL